MRHRVLVGLFVFAFTTANVYAQCKQCEATCVTAKSGETGREYCISGSASCMIWGDHCTAPACECGTTGCGPCQIAACADDEPADGGEWVLASVHTSPRETITEFQLVSVRVGAPPIRRNS